MTKFLLLSCCFLLCFVSSSQDVGISQTAMITSPQSGCEVGTSTEVINVLVQNFSSNFIPGNSITVNYTIDNGAVVSELLSTNLSGFATWNFAFNITANVSACDTFLIKSWTDLGSDGNAANDTLTWNFVNSCVIVPGSISGAGPVCVDGNTGDLDLVGMQNGTVDDWLLSTNSGASYSNLSNSGLTYTYNNVILESQYKVALDGGFCPNDTSGFVTITVDPSVYTGMTSADQFFCASSSSGQVDVTAFVSDVDDWEVSSDYGGSWSSLGNNTGTYNFSSLSGDTYYRALISSGTCGSDYSDTMKVFITPVSDAGIVNSDITVCENNNLDTLFLNNNLGGVTDWLTSNNGTTWSSTGITDSIFEFSNLNQNTYVVAVVKNGICPADTSAIATISMQPDPVADAGPNVDTPQGSSVQLNGTGGSVVVWSPGESLNDSLIYNPIASPDSTTTYTMYIMDALGCMGQDEITITILDTSIYLQIANVVTPNGDGFNDNWLMTGLDKFQQVEVSVYNSYGKRIYYSENYMNDWDVTNSGVRIPDGAYMYAIKADDLEYKGVLNVLGND